MGHIIDGKQETKAFPEFFNAKAVTVLLNFGKWERNC